MKKSLVPELVDLKITDYCPFNCSFCYMGSTVKGKHADINHLYDVIYYLSQTGVFEIAIGGGEPTMHPHFTNIIKYIAQRQIVPNFTSFSTHWMQNKSLFIDINTYCKAVAFSIQSIRDIEKYRSAFEKATRDYLSGPASIIPYYQCVVGVPSEREFSEILAHARDNGLNLTLLGFKPTHRGATFSPHSYDWYSLVKASGLSQIGIDTVLAKELPSEVPEWQYIDTEGSISFYVDAVEKKYGPSSYAIDHMESYSTPQELIHVFKDIVPI